MNDTPDTCFFARLLGQNWRTTIGQSCAAVGGVLGMTVAAGPWHIVGLVLFALGGVFAGVNGRDARVTSAQMDAAGVGCPIPMIKPPLTLFLAVLACGLLSGCVDVGHNIHIRGEGGGAEVIPSAGLLRLGYGNFAYDQANVKAGQGEVVIQDQYGMTSSNLLSRQIFAVLPYQDSTVTMEQTTQWMLCIFGFGIRNPLGKTVTEATVTPSSSTNAASAKP